MEGGSDAFLIRGSRCFDPYPCIHNLTTLTFRQREGRIQVDLVDLRDRLDELGHTQQDIFNRLQIYCRLAAIAGQQMIP